MKKTIKKVVYEIRELTVGECLPIMKDGENAGLNMVKVAVSIDGKQLGEDAMNLGYSTFNTLMGEVNKLHGIGGDDEEGED